MGEKSRNGTHPFWTKSQSRVLGGSVTQDGREYTNTLNSMHKEGDTEIKDNKYKHLKIKRLDLSKLKQGYTPNYKVEQLFAPQKMEDVKDKYLVKGLKYQEFNKNKPPLFENRDISG